MLASPSPEVLIASIAAATSRIRVGSGGVMLPHYSPLKVAETFSMLSGLYPDRIDLGLGRAPGTDPQTTLRAPARPPPARAQRLPGAAGRAARLPRRPLADRPSASPGCAVLPGPARGAGALAARLLAAERDLGRGARAAVRVRGLHQPDGRRARAVVPRDLRPFASASGAVRRRCRLGRVRRHRRGSRAPVVEHPDGDHAAAARPVDRGAAPSRRPRRSWRPTARSSRVQRQARDRRRAGHGPARVSRRSHATTARTRCSSSRSPTTTPRGGTRTSSSRRRSSCRTALRDQGGLVAGRSPRRLRRRAPRRARTSRTRLASSAAVPARRVARPFESASRTPSVPSINAWSVPGSTSTTSVGSPTGKTGCGELAVLDADRDPRSRRRSGARRCRRQRPPGGTASRPRTCSSSRPARRRPSSARPSGRASRAPGRAPGRWRSARRPSTAAGGGSFVLRTMPPDSSSRSRAARMFVPILGSASARSVYRRWPSISSRTIRSAHRSPTRSRAWATGQYWL